MVVFLIVLSIKSLDQPVVLYDFQPRVFPFIRSIPGSAKILLFKSNFAKQNVILELVFTAANAAGKLPLFKPVPA